MRILIAALAAIIACGPSSSPSLTDTQRAEFTQAIKQRSADWEAAAEHANVDEVMALYNTGAEATLIRNNRIVSLDSLRIGLTADFRDTRSQAVVVRDQRIDVLSADAVVETAAGDWASTDTAGRTSKGTFSVTRVWALRNGTWGILHTNLNVVLPPPPATRR